MSVRFDMLARSEYAKVMKEELTEIQLVAIKEIFKAWVLLHRSTVVSDDNIKAYYLARPTMLHMTETVIAENHGRTHAHNELLRESGLKGEL